jgi:signal transduction histidine kinase
MTAGGLPEKVITAFAEWKKQPEAVSAAKMHALTLDEHPSVITTEIMHTVDPADHTGWKAKWRRIEHAQAFLRSGGFPAEGVRQMETRTDALGAVWLLGPPRQLQNIDELNDRIELSSRFPSNPCQLYVSIGREAEKHLLMPGEVLATYGTLPVVTAIAEPADMDALFAFQHRLTLGFVALMAVSVFSAMWGLVSLRRSVLQQQALSELKTNFIASVTHELRAPVASMQLLAEGLQNGSVSTEAKRGEYFRLIVEE